MITLKEQFDAQCSTARLVAMFNKIEVDVVIVKHRNKDRSRISILGNAISRAHIGIWRADGSQVRILCHYGPSGIRTQPKRKNQ